MELSKNIRSGHDYWWNDVLDECRVGRQSEHNFCYLHGFPTTAIRKAPIKFGMHTDTKHTALALVL